MKSAILGYCGVVGVWRTRSMRVYTISTVGLLSITSMAIAVPMPDPADLAGLQIVEVDVPDEEVVDILLRSGIDGLACRPAPGRGPWVVDQSDRSLLDGLGLTYTTLIADLAAHQTSRNAERRAARAASRGLDGFYLDYRTYAEYQDRMDVFLANNSDIATGVILGQSHEGRDIRGVVINVDGSEKPGVLFNGCQHAREWISPPSTWYIA
ncbi:MAG: hypothetical protein MK100_06015, partial [Phycisphaerales bacterium]|nr:hypothetical protein [Phycisphaerales bacterium]